MKHLFCVLLFGLLTVGCSSEILENRETRSTVYVGQSTWDMYENFGAPTFAVRVSPEEVHFIYRKEEITRDWTNMYFDWCDMVVMTVNDYVVDWDLVGNQCYLNIADEKPLPDGENERENALRKYVIPNNNYQEDYSDRELQSSDNDYETLF